MLSIEKIENKKKGRELKGEEKRSPRLQVQQEGYWMPQEADTYNDKTGESGL